ncbi:MAG: hypothetical protein JXP34_14085 [Planctomycetes bacterium]|nr:hypothetical protein [Planctomycetota bacterium]
MEGIHTTPIARRLAVLPAAVLLLAAGTAGWGAEPAAPAGLQETRLVIDPALGLSFQVPVRFQSLPGGASGRRRYSDPARGETLEVGRWPGDRIPEEPSKEYDDRVVAQAAREFGRPLEVLSSDSARDGAFYRVHTRFRITTDPVSYAWVDLVIAETGGAILILEGPQDAATIEEALGAPPDLRLTEPPPPGPALSGETWRLIILSVSAIVASLLIAKAWRFIARLTRLRRFTRARVVAIAIVILIFAIAALWAWFGMDAGPARTAKLEGLAIACAVSSIIASIAAARMDRRGLGRLRSPDERPPWVNSFRGR